MPLPDLRPQAIRRRDPQVLLKHLQSFSLDLKFSAGIWFFSPPGSRFHDRYGKALDIAQRLERAASLASYGLKAMEAHYPNEINEENAGLWKKFSQQSGIRILTVIPLLIAFEPKPYEPRGHILFGTTPEGLLLGHQVEGMLRHQENKRLLGEGHALVCMNPEIGHVLMGYEDLAYAYSWPLSQGRLAHTHLNSQPLGNYDQDLNVGVIGPEQLEAMLYTLKMYGYSGYFGIDINPERMPVETALRNSMDALRTANDRINEIDHEAVLYAQLNPDKARGWLEAYLIRQRAPHPERLAPLPKPQG